MNIRKIVMRVGFLMALLAGGGGAVYALDNTSMGKVSTPRVYLTSGKSDPDPARCSIEIKAGNYKLSDLDGCSNDEYSWYRFDNVPSAALIGFGSEGSCKRDGDWFFEVRTYINPVTSEWRKIEDLKFLKKGDIVTAGVMFESGGYSHGNIQGKLSCVTIDY